MSSLNFFMEESSSFPSTDHHTNIPESSLGLSICINNKDVDIEIDQKFGKYVITSVSSLAVNVDEVDEPTVRKAKRFR